MPYLNAQFTRPVTRWPNGKKPGWYTARGWHLPDSFEICRMKGSLTAIRARGQHTSSTKYRNNCNSSMRIACVRENPLDGKRLDTHSRSSHSPTGERNTSLLWRHIDGCKPYTAGRGTMCKNRLAQRGLSRPTQSSRTPKTYPAHLCSTGLDLRAQEELRC